MHSARLALILLTLSATAPQAEEIGDAARGEQLFAQNCAACHGSEAQGDGPMAATLAKPPANLTVLGARAEFPTAKVTRTIDGRDLISHGGPMPLFGNLLKDRSAVVDDADGNPVFTSQPVLDIVVWLQTIQQD